MKRNAKKLFLTCLSVASIACGALALGTATVATADGATPIIALQDGASCRGNRSFRRTQPRSFPRA